MEVVSKPAIVAPGEEGNYASPKGTCSSSSLERGLTLSPYQSRRQNDDKDPGTLKLYYHEASGESSGTPEHQSNTTLKLRLGNQNLSTSRASLVPQSHMRPPFALNRELIFLQSQNVGVHGAANHGENGSHNSTQFDTRGDLSYSTECNALLSRTRFCSQSSNHNLFPDGPDDGRYRMSSETHNISCALEGHSSRESPNKRFPASTRNPHLAVSKSSCRNVVSSFTASRSLQFRGAAQNDYHSPYSAAKLDQPVLQYKPSAPNLHTITTTAVTIAAVKELENLRTRNSHLTAERDKFYRIAQPKLVKNKAKKLDVDSLNRRVNVLERDLHRLKAKNSELEVAIAGFKYENVGWQGAAEFYYRLFENLASDDVYGENADYEINKWRKVAAGREAGAMCGDRELISLNHVVGRDTRVIQDAPGQVDDSIREEDMAGANTNLTQHTEVGVAEAEVASTVVNNCESYDSENLVFQECDYVMDDAPGGIDDSVRQENIAVENNSSAQANRVGVELNTEVDSDVAMIHPWAVQDHPSPRGNDHGTEDAPCEANESIREESTAAQDTIITQHMEVEAKSVEEVAIAAWDSDDLDKFLANFQVRDNILEPSYMDDYFANNQPLL